MLVDCNLAATELAGRSRGELIGQSHQILHAPRERQGRFTEAFRRHLTTDQGQVLESTIVTSGGEIRHVAIKANLVHIGDRQLLDGMFRDTTEPSGAEERLSLLSLAVEQSTEGICVVDPTGKVQFVNEAFARMHGYDCNEVLNEHLAIFHLPGQLSAVRKANRQILETGQYAGEIWHGRKDGTTFLGMMHNTLLRDAAGKPTGIMAVLRDITAWKEAKLVSRVSLRRLSIPARASPSGMTTGS